MAKDAKKAAQEAAEELGKFLKKNSLKREVDYSNHKDKKIASKFKELTLALQKANDAVSGTSAKKEKAKDTPAAKTDKKGKDKKESKKGGVGRTSKYDYPEGLTPAEKKEFRIKARKDAKAAAKGGDKAKKEKVTEKEKKVTKDDKKSKDSKKDKKKDKKDKKND